MARRVKEMAVFRELSGVPKWPGFWAQAGWTFRQRRCATAFIAPASALTLATNEVNMLDIHKSGIPQSRRRLRFRATRIATQKSLETGSTSEVAGFG
jgi:hypothetical protein